MYAVKLKNIIAVAAAVLAVIAVSVTARIAVDTYTYTPSDEAVKVPILMYHSVLKQSDGNKYTVSPADVESDLKYLASHGYCTVVIDDLIDYVYDGKELPEKPVILTFDDGFYNNYYYIYPMLKKYQARAVISIVGSYTEQFSNEPDENPNYSYLTWDDIREMMSSGYVEIQNHTYDLHSLKGNRKGCKKNYGESAEEYKAMLTRDLTTLQEDCEKHLGSAPTAFTYPFGIISEESVDVVKDMGFKSSLSCEEGVNELERNPEQLYRLKRYIRTPERRAADILSAE